MLMTKKKILATLVATTLVISTIMPSVALALDTVEETEPTTVTTTETEPAVTEPTTVPETSETSAQPAETTEESKATEETTSETTATESTPSDIPESSESTEETAPSTSETTVEATEPTESSVDTSEPVEEVAFNQSKTVDGIKITVEADKGVFPEGAELSVIKINKVAINKEDNLVASMTFDISIMLDGKEIEPDTTKGEVKVTFFDERFADKNLDAAIYHTSDDKKTEEMDIETVEGGAQVTTDGFSLYTVEFTYGDMQYTIQGNSAVALSTILEKVGLEGEVTDVEISNSELFKYEDGNIFALKAFTSKEWMKVTINGITYIIVVTDNPDNPEDATAGVDAYAVLYSDGTLAFQKGTDAIAAYGTIVNSWLIPTAYPTDDPDTEDVNESYPDWYASADTITKVVFVDNIKGITSLAYYFYRLSNLDTFENLDRLNTKDVTSLYETFSYCSSIEDLDLSSWNTSKVTNISTFVMNCSSLKTLNLSNWDFSALNSTGGALSGCTALKTLDLSNTKLPVDTYNAGLCLGWHMAGSGCSLDEVIVTGIDLSQTTSLYGFLSIPAKKVTGLTTWDVSNVVSISSLFNGNSLIENVDISGWDLRNMRNTYGSAIFSGCANLKTLNMSNVKMPADTAASNFQLGWGNIGGTLNSINVTNLDLSGTTSLNGFLTCPAKEIIGLNTWDTSNVTNFTSLFNGQRYITSLDLSNFTFSSNATVGAMCVNMYKLNTITLPDSFSNVNISDTNHLNLDYIWKNSDGDVFTSQQITLGGTYTLDLDPNKAYCNTDAYAVLYSNGTLVFQKGDEALDGYGDIVESWEVTNYNTPWTDSTNTITTVEFKVKLVGRSSCSYMFSGMKNLTTVKNPENLDTSSVTSMRSMFYNTPRLTSIDVSSWDTSKVTNFAWMFGCDSSADTTSQLTAVTGAENLVQNEATTIYCMFYDCKALTTIDVSNWDVSNVTNISWCFTRANITKLDLSNWDLSSNTVTTYFILGTNNLTEITLSSTFRNLPEENTTTGFSGKWYSTTSNISYTASEMEAYVPTATETFKKVAVVGSNAYAILYTDGYLVFQASNQPDPEHGSVANSWTVNATNRDWYYNKSIKYVDFKDKLEGRTSCAYMFRECSGLKEVFNAQNLDMSQVTSMGQMFGQAQASVGCKELTAIHGIEEWRPINCTDFSYAFSYTVKLEELDMSNWTVNQAQNISRMFQGSSVKVIDFSGFNFTSGANCSYALSNNTKLVKIILPTSFTNCSENYRKNIGANSASTDWLKDDTTPVKYNAPFTSGTYDKLYNAVTVKVDTNTEHDITYYITDAHLTYNMPEAPTANANGDAFISWVDLSGKEFTGTIIDKDSPAVICAKFEHEVQDAVFGEDLYVMYYNSNGNKVLVYQKGNTPDAEYGTLVGSTLLQTATNLSIYVDMDTIVASGIRFGQYYTEPSRVADSNINRVVVKDRLTNLPSGTYYFSLYNDSSDKYFENLDYIDTSNATGIRFTTNGSRTIHGLDKIANWNTSNVTTLDEVFYDVDFTKTDIPDLSNWDTSKVTTMLRAFRGTVGDMSFARNWTTDNVTNMYEIFYNCELDKLTVANWKTDNVTTLRSAFAYSKGTTDLSDLSNWNTSKVTDMKALFYESDHGNISAIENWDLSSCETLELAFANNDNFGSRAFNVIKDWDVSNVSNFASIFENDTGLTEAEINWDFSKATNMSSMFSGCTKLTTFTGHSTWTPTAETNRMDRLFYNCNSLIDISGVRDWNTSNVTDMGYMFYRCNNLPTLAELANWDVSKVGNMASMFEMSINGVATLYDISALANWQTSSLTNLNATFINNAKIKSVEALKDWDVSHVTTMHNLFNSCYSIESLEPLSGWTTSSLVYLSNAFMTCYGLKNLKGLENWDVSHVTTMQSTFQYCINLEDASAISNWNTAALTNYNNMFLNCRKLAVVDMGGWDLSHMTHENNILTYDSNGRANQSAGVFSGCNSLIKITFPSNFTINTAANYSNATGSYFYNTDVWMYDRAGGSSSKGPLDGDWVFEPTGETVKLHDEILPNFTEANGGTYLKEYELILYPMGGNVDPQRINRLISTEITELPEPTRDGYTFLGWYDSNGDKRTSIAAGEYVKSLFAKWETDGYYTLILDPNIDGIDPVYVHLNPTELYNVRSSVFSGVPSDYEFLYWTERKSNAGNRYKDGAEISHLGEIDDTVTLYAQWISHTTIPVKIHAINIITGEETDVVNFNATANTTNSTNDIKKLLTLPDKNDDIRFFAYAGDLDLVHFDKEANSQYITDVGVYYYSEYSDPYGKNYLGSTTYPREVINIERSQYIDISNHTWVLSDINKDIYAYYLPAPRVKVYFNPQQEEWFPVDELIMTVDGKEYKSGEYELSIPWSYDAGYYDSYYSYKDANNNWEYTCFTPDYYANALWYKDGYSIAEYVEQELAQIGYYFNYPVYLYQVSNFDTYPGLGDVFGTTEETYTSSYYNSPSATYHNRPRDWVGSIIVGFSYLDIVYDVNADGGTAKFNKSQFKYLEHFVQIGYQGGNIAALKSYPINYTVTRPGYKFDGWWTAPEGGRQIYRPGENYSSTAPHDISDCPVIDYGDTWTNPDNPDYKYTSRQNTNSIYTGYVNNQYQYANSMTFTNNRYVTMYAHWIPEDEWVQPYPGTDFDPNTDHEFALFVLHNTHATQEVTEIKIDAPVKTWYDYFDIPESQKDQSVYEDYIFMGWFTEPNGQGEQIYKTDDGYFSRTIQPGRLDLYAYWTSPSKTIYFDPYGSGEYPTDAKVVFSLSKYKDIYNTTTNPASIKCTDTIGAYAIPFAISNDTRYVFEGWFDDDNHELQAGDITVDGKIYHAKWSKVTNNASAVDYVFTFTTDNNTPYKVLDSYSTTSIYTKTTFAVSLKNDVILPAGAVKIYLPDDYMLNYDVIDSYTDISQGKYFMYKNNSQYSNPEDYKLGEVTISNGVDLTGSSQFEMQSRYTVDLEHSLIAKDAEGNVYDGWDKTSTVYKTTKPVILMIDEDLDGTPEVVEYKYIYVESVPRPEVTSYSKFVNLRVEGSVSTPDENYWPSNWGVRPDDWDEYYYITWNIQTSDANYNNYGNQNLSYYYSAGESKQQGEIVYSQPATYKGITYDSDYGSWGKAIVMKYPKSQFNYNAQRAVITQPFDIVVAPQYNWENTDEKYDLNIVRTGSVTIDWSEGLSIHNGNEVWANMGRYANGTFVSQVNSTNEVKLQRQMAMFDQSASGFSWFSLYALDNTKVQHIKETAVSVEPGDFSYVSGASEDFWMYEPTTGRIFLSEDDYKITGYTWYIFSGHKEGSTVQMYDRKTPVDVYVKHRGSDEWVLSYSGIGSSSSKAYNDGHVNVVFDREQSTTFNGAANSDIVAVSVRAKYDDNSDYQVICIVPNVTILNTAKTKSFTKMDYDQKCSSAIALNDFKINGNVTYTSGSWGANLVWDEDLGLCTWHLTSDASPLTEVNRIVNNNYPDYCYYRVTEDGDLELDIEILNQSQDASTFYIPIDSGEYYLLLPEGTSLKKTRQQLVGGTSATLSGLYSSYSDRTRRLYGNIGLTRSIPAQNVTVETIENWEDSGRTMVKYTFNNLTSLHDPASNYNGIQLILTVNRDETNREIYGWKGEVAGMFINTTDNMYYAGRSNDYASYVADVGYWPIRQQLIDYFSNIYEDNVSKKNKIAVTANSVTFYASNPDVVEETVAHQNGFNEFMANSSGTFSNGAQVFPGETYTYKVYWSQADTYNDASTRTDGIVMYTKLDGVGKLVSAKVPTLNGKVYTSATEFEEVVVKPTVWYCTDPSFAEMTSDEFKTFDVSTLAIDADHGWTTTKPADGIVYGMIFDYSKDDQGRTVTIEKDKYINIDLHMKNMATEPQTFTSTSRMLANGFALGNDVTGGNMLGEVVMPNLKIDVLSTPASGTIDQPASVTYEQDLIYNWTVTNNESRSIENVIVSFKLPNEVNGSLAKIVAGGVSITQHSNIKDISLENGIVTLTIKNLNADSVFEFRENTYVTETRNNIVITNQGFINSYNDITPRAQDIEAYASTITYHETFNVPDPTGFNSVILPYIGVFSIASVAMYIAAKKKKKQEEE